MGRGREGKNTEKKVVLGCHSKTTSWVRIAYIHLPHFREEGEGGNSRITHKYSRVDT